MNEKPKGTILPKQQLEILKYEGDVPYGQAGKTLDRMTAKNLSLLEGDPLVGKSIRYTIFNPDLKAFLCTKEVGFRFLADIEERERPGTEYGPDRTINQVYIDGKPVSTKKPGPGGGYGQSPENIRLKGELDLALEAVRRVSIEGQTAIAQVGNLLTCPMTFSGEAWERIMGKYWKAIEQSLDNFLSKAPNHSLKSYGVPRETTPLSRTTHQPRQDSQQTAPETDTVSNDAPPPSDPVKHVGDLLTRAGKLDPPVNSAEVAQACHVERPDQFTDLEDAWKKVQAYSKKKKNPADSEWDKLTRDGS